MAITNSTNVPTDKNTLTFNFRVSIENSQLAGVFRR